MIRDLGFSLRVGEHGDHVRLLASPEGVAPQNSIFRSGTEERECLKDPENMRKRINLRLCGTPSRLRAGAGEGSMKNTECRMKPQLPRFRESDKLARRGRQLAGPVMAPGLESLPQVLEGQINHRRAVKGQGLGEQ